MPTGSDEKAAPLPYRTRFALERRAWWRCPHYWVLFVMPSLPLVLLLIPHSFTFMAEPTDPWYTRYTTPLALASIFYLCPVTAISAVVGAKIGGAVWVVLALAYTNGLAWLLCVAVAGRKRRG